MGRRRENMTSQAEERIGVGRPTPWWWEHRARYRWSAPHVAGKRALDIACGTGYGSVILAQAGARIVIGIDLSESALDYANRRYNEPNLAFCRASASDIPYEDQSFDLVTSFETIEHLQDAERFLSELRRVLSPQGKLYLSTPNALVTQPIDGVPRNPYHVREFTPPELREALEKQFATVELLGQVIAPSFGYSPYWKTGLVAQSPLRRLSSNFLWKIRNRMMPLEWNEALNRSFGLNHFVPHEDDWIFEPNHVWEAHVLLAACTGTR